MTPIYLDYNATTPIDPAVASAMRPFLDEAYGNPSSGHWASTPAKTALEHARGQVAALLGCSSDEIVLTSGGSEANNLAIKGTFFALRDKGEHIVTTQVEHPAVLAPCRFLERLGARVTYLPVDTTGRIDPEAVRRAITPRTILGPGSASMRQTGLFCERRMSGSSQPPRSEDEADIRADEESTRRGRPEGHPAGHAPPVLRGGEDPHRAGGPVRGGEHCRAVSARGDQLVDVLRLVQGVPGGWQAPPGRRHRPGAATSDEVRDLRRETSALKEVVADLTLENRLLKKSMSGAGGDDA